MTVFIGTDEAGYGPNLGPLVITATAWRFPQATASADCWNLLSDCVSRTAPRSPIMLHVGDSKQVYSSGRSIERLEHAVLSMLALRDQHPRCFTELGQCAAGDTFVKSLTAEPCRAPTSAQLPVAADIEFVKLSAARLRLAFAEQGVALLDIRSCVLFPAEFNRRVDEAGSKGRVLSSATLNLVADIVYRHQITAAQIICDKHGGRNRYDELLSDAFNDRLVFRLQEGRPVSRYRLDGLEFRFQTKAEEHLPVALASMVSKYLRETAMMEFNAFWNQHIPNVKPTLGYPVDAARFMEDVQDVFDNLQLNRDEIWRKR